MTNPDESFCGVGIGVAFIITGRIDMGGAMSGIMVLRGTARAPAGTVILSSMSALA